MSDEFENINRSGTDEDVSCAERSGNVFWNSFRMGLVISSKFGAQNPHEMTVAVNYC